MSLVVSVDALSDDDAFNAAAPNHSKKKETKTTGKGRKDEKKPKAAPKAKQTALKRPAAALSSPSKGDPASLKRPASKVVKEVAKDPEKVSVCKSLYKRNGVWSLKLNQKEVIRVTC